MTKRPNSALEAVMPGEMHRETREQRVLEPPTKRMTLMPQNTSGTQRMGQSNLFTDMVRLPQKSKGMPRAPMVSSLAYLNPTPGPVVRMPGLGNTPIKAIDDEVSRSSLP